MEEHNHDHHDHDHSTHAHDHPHAGMGKETEDKINQLTMLEQNLQNVVMQRQQFMTQLREVETAHEELEKTKTAYKIVGNIMVLTDKEELKIELTSKMEMLKLRISTIENQEAKLKKKGEDLQAQILGKMKK